MKKSIRYVLLVCALGVVALCQYVLGGECSCKIARPQAACVACVTDCCTMSLRQDGTPCEGYVADYVIGCECGYLSGGDSDCVVQLDSNGQMVVINNIIVRIYPGQCDTGCCDFDVANAYDYPGNFALTTSKLCYGYA